MMRLPVLDAQERAYLQALQPHGALQVFASRLRQHLLASLGAPVEVSALPDAVQASPAGSEPSIAIAPELAAAWLGLRFGGKPGAGDRPPAHAALCKPFVRMIRRALAESVVNAGTVHAWPAVMRLQLSMGGGGGAVDIVWNSVHAQAWARGVIRERA
jgi:hypothetical protein